MAQGFSSKKRVRQNEVRSLRNHARKQRLKTEARRFNDAVHSGNAEQAKTTLVRVAKLLDRTAAKGTIHKNAAARRKSRLAKRLNKMAPAAPA